MYQRDVSTLPIEISRDDFVDIIVEIGSIYNHTIETTVAAVILGDYFISFNSPRSPYIPSNRRKKDVINTKNILAQSTINNLTPLPTQSVKHVYKSRDIPFNEPISQIYSIELAHVVTVIAAKYNEDYGYRNIKQACFDTNNYYVVKMEWEICSIIGLHVKIKNFVSLFAIILEILGINSSKEWHPKFYFICYEICYDKILLNTHPKAILMGILLLFKHNKLPLNCIENARRIIFERTMIKISHISDTDISDVIKAYIMMKKNILSDTLQSPSLILHKISNNNEIIQIDPALIKLMAK